MNPTEPFGLISLNANGLGKIKKRNSLFHWLKQFHNAETKIVFIQETHTTEKIEKSWEKEWDKCDIYFSHGSSDSKGVATIIPKAMNCKVNTIDRSKNGRFLAINITINENTFYIVNCYAPNTTNVKDQLAWLTQVQTLINKNIESNLIIGGDLNDVFNPQMDRYRCPPNVKVTEYMKAWKTICEELNIADFWRLLNPEKRSYTWRQGKSAATLKQSRIDYWLVNIHMMYDLDIIDIKASSYSDHSLIILDFYRGNEPTRGPSFWRFNASLLKDTAYTDKLKQK